MFVLVVAAGLAASATSFAQSRQQVRDQYEITSQISEAMRVLSSDPERALGILHRLDFQFPDNDRVLARMGYVSQVIGRTDSAEVYFERAIQINPTNLEAGKALGQMMLSTGRDREAMAVFESLIEASDHSISAYKMVGTTLRDLGRYDDALAIYKRGREQNVRNTVLTLEIAEMHSQLGNYEDAIDEYLTYASYNARNFRYVRERILDVIRRAGDATPRVVAHLETLAVRDANKGGFMVRDVLSAYYLGEGLLEQALDMALQADNARSSDGAVLLTLAERILTQADIQPRNERARYLELGVRALDAFARNHPKAPGTDRAKYMLGVIYVEFGSGRAGTISAVERNDYLERAVSEFTDISRRYPNSEYAEQAYLDRGEVLLHNLKRPRDALEAYKSGAVNSRMHGDVFAARIGDVYLGLGDYDDAHHYIESLSKSGVPELVQTGDYYIGLLLAFQGNYEAARDTLTHLADANPSAPYTNDAIATAWVIEEGLQYDSKVLPEYFGSLRAELIGDTASVVTQLQTIVNQAVYETLRPRALFWLGVTYYESGEFDASLAALRRFLKEYPDEGMRPDVQRQLGHVYEFGYREYPRALEEYEKVLVSYPDYAFLDDVRKDVRRLRFIVHGEEYEQ